MSEERKHAILSASGASRWLNCPPSARLEEEFQEETSTYAEEGTLAHAVAELHLSRALNMIEAKTFLNQMNAYKEKIDEDMLDALSYYTDFVLTRVAESRNHTPDSLIFLEQRLDFSDWVPEGFGTGDVVVIGDGALEIIDLKYGKGVPVSAENNKQMMLYALGTLAAFETLYDIDVVNMSICQPRIENFSTHTIPVAELKKWSEENNTELYNPIELAYLLNEELALILCGNFCDVAEERQTNSEVVKDHLIDELSDAVKKVIDDADSKSGDHWPDVISKCRSAYLKKIKFETGDN
jgi:hypothetical protein